MNPNFIVTDEMVLRWPFAVNPARITSEMERDIARRMAAQAKAEGHSARLPSMKPQNAEKLLSDAEFEAEIARTLLGGPARSINWIRMAVHRDRSVVEQAVARMFARGALFVAGIAMTGGGRGRAKLYALTKTNFFNQPTEELK